MLYSEEAYTLYSSTNIIRLIKQKKTLVSIPVIFLIRSPKYNHLKVRTNKFFR